MRENLKAARKAADMTQQQMAEVPTCELVAELKKRQGVSWHSIGADAEITVHETGPAVVLSVID